MEKFFDQSFTISKDEMRHRIRKTCSALGWQAVLLRVLKGKIPFEHLKVAEIGCGTGTFSLTLNFLGINTTLIDADTHALEAARKVFSLYKREAEFVKADVLEPVFSNLAGCFDLVISGGLAEHFVGEDRKKCLSFHKALLRKGGFAYICVPNKLSLPYQIVRYFKMLTGKWRLSIEKPFSYWELKKLGEKAGFMDNKIVGNHLLREDVFEYSLGLVSAMLDLLPSKARKMVNQFRSKRLGRDENTYRESSREEDIVLNKVDYLRKHPLAKKDRRFLKDYFSAGIALIGFKEGSNVKN